MLLSNIKRGKMKKILIFIFVSFFIISSTSATLLLLHPPKIEFSGNTNERICQTVTVFSDYRGNLSARIRWTDKADSKDLNDYNLDSTNLSIINGFAEKIVSNNDQKEVDVCLTFEKSGEYYGALLYNAETGSAGVGIWAYANIKGDSHNVDISEITGNVVINLKGFITNITKAQNPKVLLVSSTTFLLFILLMLLLVVDKKIKREEEAESEINLKEEIKDKPKVSKSKKELSK
jgi:hypothetical protein